MKSFILELFEKDGQTTYILRDMIRQGVIVHVGSLEDTMNFIKEL